jgi:hypothetical protein
MNPQVTAAVISASAALVVAVAGIAGAIAAQAIATRRAFENSLGLWQQQLAVQERERLEQSRREDAYRFAEQRRALYARFLRRANDLNWAYGDLPSSKKQEDDPDGWERYAKALDQADRLLEEIDLLGSADVRRTADTMFHAAMQQLKPPGSYSQARKAFLEAAQHELGLVTGHTRGDMTLRPQL